MCVRARASTRSERTAPHRSVRPPPAAAIPVQIKEPSPEHEETFESSGYDDTDDGGVGGGSGGADDDDSTDSEYGAGANGDSDVDYDADTANGTATGCVGRMRKHLRDVGGKISTVTGLDCSADGSGAGRMSWCMSWFCVGRAAPTGGDDDDGTARRSMGARPPKQRKQRKQRTQREQPQRTPSTETFQGPEPSPTGVTAYDDSVPPPKNCYRLVMLG